MAPNDGRPAPGAESSRRNHRKTILVENPQGVRSVIVQVANMESERSWKGPVYVGGIILRPDGPLEVGCSMTCRRCGRTALADRGLTPVSPGFHVHPYLNFMTGFNWLISVCRQVSGWSW